VILDDPADNKLMRTRIPVVIGVAVVVLASYGVLREPQNMPDRLLPIAETLIVVTTRDVRVGEQLEADHVRLQAWPADSLVRGAFTAVEDVVGRRALKSLVANEPITIAKVDSIGN
jgi:Flp pilus assembly protein CpaB